jgi:hypothetical protein
LYKFRDEVMYRNELSEIVANQRDTKNGHVIEPNHTKQNRNRA